MILATALLCSQDHKGKCFKKEKGDMKSLNFIAHRGESAIAPENTMASFRQAWALDADGAECDIHLTKDNRIVIIHDDNTKRTSGVDMEISSSLSGDLRKIDVGSFKDTLYRNEIIPFLEEAISIIPEKKFFVIEIKCGTEVIPYLKKVLDDSQKKDQIKLISFGWEVILEAKKEFPEIPCYWLSSKKETLLQKMDEAAAAGLDGVDLKYSLVDSEVMKKAAELNLDIITWTVDDPQEAKRLTDLGVKSFTTNNTQKLEEELTKLF